MLLTPYDCACKLNEDAPSKCPLVVAPDSILEQRIFNYPLITELQCLNTQSVRSELFHPSYEHFIYVQARITIKYFTLSDFKLLIPDSKMEQKKV